MKALISFTRRFRGWFGRYFPVHWESWQRLHVLTLILLALILILSLAWGDPVSGWNGEAGSTVGNLWIDATNATPTVMGIQVTATPFPPELMNNLKQTNGVIIITIIIVMIIFAGAISANHSRRTE
jgi:hypothetical protein